MRILVTGGAGFVGSHIVDHLIARGDQVVVVDNLSTGRPENVNPKATLIRGDAAQCLTTVGGVDVIIHAAAYADLRHNWERKWERDKLYAANLDVTRALLEGMQSGTRFLFLSTASVYGAAKNEIPVVETDAGPHTCESPYAASKMACEAMIAAYAFARKFRWKIGRLVNVVGARTKHGVIGDFTRMAEAGGKIHAADNGKQRKSWVNVHDVADAFLRMGDDDVPDGIYSITSPARISWWEVVDLMGVPRSEVTFEDRAGGAIGDPIDLHVSGDKLRPYYRPKFAVADGIKDALVHLGWQT